MGCLWTLWRESGPSVLMKSCFHDSMSHRDSCCSARSAFCFEERSVRFLFMLPLTDPLFRTSGHFPMGASRIRVHRLPCAAFCAGTKKSQRPADAVDLYRFDASLQLFADLRQHSRVESSKRTHSVFLLKELYDQTPQPVKSP